MASLYNYNDIKLTFCQFIKSELCEVGEGIYFKLFVYLIKRDIEIYKPPCLLESSVGGNILNILHLETDFQQVEYFIFRICS